jgi:formylglycine-generating enzyme required for sulfatase activity
MAVFQKDEIIGDQHWKLDTLILDEPGKRSIWLAQSLSSKQWGKLYFTDRTALNQSNTMWKFDADLSLFALSQIKSSLIMPILEWNEISEGFFVVFEMPQSIALADLLKEDFLEEDTVALIFSSLAQLLEQCHQAGIVHGALSSNHIYVNSFSQAILEGFFDYQSGALFPVYSPFTQRATVSMTELEDLDTYHAFLESSGSFYALMKRLEVSAQKDIFLWGQVLSVVLKINLVGEDLKEHTPYFTKWWQAPLGFQEVLEEVSYFHPMKNIGELGKILRQNHMPYLYMDASQQVVQLKLCEIAKRIAQNIDSWHMIKSQMEDDWMPWGDVPFLVQLVGRLDLLDQKRQAIILLEQERVEIRKIEEERLKIAREYEQKIKQEEEQRQQILLQEYQQRSDLYLREQEDLHQVEIQKLNLLQQEKTQAIDSLKIWLYQKEQQLLEKLSEKANRFKQEQIHKFTQELETKSDPNNANSDSNLNHLKAQKIKAFHQRLQQKLQKKEAEDLDKIKQQLIKLEAENLAQIQAHYEKQKLEEQEELKQQVQKLKVEKQVQINEIAKVQQSALIEQQRIWEEERARRLKLLEEEAQQQLTLQKQMQEEIRLSQIRRKEAQEQQRLLAQEQAILEERERQLRLKENQLAREAEQAEAQRLAKEQIKALEAQREAQMAQEQAQMAQAQMIAEQNRIAYEEMMAEQARLDEENARLEEENTRLEEEQARLKEEQARLEKEQLLTVQIQLAYEQKQQEQAQRTQEEQAHLAMVQQMLDPHYEETLSVMGDVRTEVNHLDQIPTPVYEEFDKKVIQIEGLPLTFSYCKPGSIANLKIDQSFWIAQIPITQMLWFAVMKNNPSRFRNPENPVDDVSWYDAQRFCQKLNQLFDFENPFVIGEGKRPIVAFKVEPNPKAEVKKRPSSYAFSLPTEAQWEYAAYAGKITKYSGTDDELNEFAWFNSNALGQTHPVGLKKANANGLYDMSGNVWEWCLDAWHQEIDEIRNGVDPIYYVAQPTARCIKGGAFYDFPTRCEITHRVSLSADDRYGVGFRIVLMMGDE